MIKTQTIGRKVVEKIGGWIARGLLTGDKADQYLEALAKARRARRIFRDKSRVGRHPSYFKPGYFPVD